MDLGLTDVRFRIPRGGGAAGMYNIYSMQCSH